MIEKNNIKKLGLLLLVHISAFASTNAENLPNSHTETSNRIEILERSVNHHILSRHGSDLVSAYKMWRNQGYTDDEIKKILLYNILQPDVGVGNKSSRITSNACDVAMTIYKGDPDVEKAVLEACDSTRYYGELIKPHDFLRTQIAAYGSDELISEYKDYLQDKYGPSEVINFDKRVSNRDRFKRSTVPTPALDVNTGHDKSGKLHEFSDNQHIHNSENTDIERIKIPRRHIYTKICLLVLGIITLFIGLRLKIKSLILSAVLLIVVALVIHYKFRVVETATSNISNVNPDSDIAHLHHEKCGHNHVISRQRNVTKDITSFAIELDAIFTIEELERAVNILMTPFFDNDPLDAEKNLQMRIIAAGQLMELLHTPKPDDITKDDWLRVVRRIIEVQSCSLDTMSSTVKLLNTWVESDNRAHEEIVEALRSASTWKSFIVNTVDSPMVDLKKDIAELNIKLLAGVSEENCPQVFALIESASLKVRNDNGEIDVIKIVSDDRLLELLNTHLATYPKSANIALMVMANRIKSSPSSFPDYDNNLRKLITDESLDWYSRAIALEAITNQSVIDGSAPKWVDDDLVLKQLTDMRSHSGKDSTNAYIRNNDADFIDARVLAVIKNRLDSNNTEHVKRYKSLVLDIANGNHNYDDVRLSALEMAISAKLITYEELRNVYSGDDNFSKLVQKAYPVE